MKFRPLISDQGELRYAITVGTLATIAGGALITLGSAYNVLGIKTLVEFVLLLIFMALYPEPIKLRWSITAIIFFIAAGCLLGMGWVISISMHGDSIKFVEWKDFSFCDVFIGFTNAIVVAPLFEEKVVRHLLLQGLMRKLGPFISTVLVSVVFAFAHPNNLVWTFLLSLTLCVMAIKYGANTYQRTVVHGTFNLIVMLWFFTGG